VENPSSGGPADLKWIQLLGILLLPSVVFPDQGLPRQGCTGTQLAPGPSQECFSPCEPNCRDITQRTGLVVCTRNWFSSFYSLENSPKERPPFSGMRHNSPVVIYFKPEASLHASCIFKVSSVNGLVFFQNTFNRPHNRRPRAQDLHMQHLHLQDRLRHLDSYCNNRFA